MGALVLVLAAVDAVRAARLVQQAQASLLSSRAALLEGASAGAARDTVLQAQPPLARAAELLQRPAPRAVAAVPLLGRTLDLETAAVRSAGSTVQALRTALEGASAVRSGDGGVDAGALVALGTDLERDTRQARRDLRTVRGLPYGAVPTPVARAVSSAAAELEQVVVTLSQGADAARVAGELLGDGGPRHLLVALQNNAELRGAGGYVSSVARARTTAGRIALTPFRDVLDVYQPPDEAVRVPAPPELREDYGAFLADTTLWRTWTMSPDVPEVAQVGANVAERLLGSRPDAVLLLDVPALAALAEATGGVELDGRTLSGDELAEALLVDAYASAGLSPVEQVRRRQRLQQAASASLQRLLATGANPLAVARTLGGLAEGRHLAVWSARPDEQRVLQQLGVSGEVGVGCGDLVSVNANNLNANKLDYYVSRTLDVDVTVHERSADVVQRVALRNDAPAGLVPYVAGSETPRVLVERVEFSAGPRAEVESLTVAGTSAPGTVRRSPDRTRVATTVRLVPGRELVLELRYALPRDGEAYRLELLPQPLAHDAQVRLRVRAAAGLRLPGLPAGGEVLDGAFTRQRVVEVDPVPVPAPEGPLARLLRWLQEPLRVPSSDG